MRNSISISSRVALLGCVLAASIYFVYFHYYTYSLFFVDKMRSSTTVAVLTALSLVGEAWASPSQLRARDLESFIAKEREVAYQGVLANIGANGAKVAGASAGLVIASPDKEDPDCTFFQQCSSLIWFMANGVRRLLYMDTRCCSHHEDFSRRVHLWQD